MTSPDDHFAAGPNRGVNSFGHLAHWQCWSLSKCWCWDCISRRCLDRCITGSVEGNPSPNDHFAASPHCPVAGSAEGALAGARGDPTIRVRIVSATRVQVTAGPAPPQTIISLPVHTAPCESRALGALRRAQWCPSICSRIVYAAGVQIVIRTIKSAPDYHFAAGPHCRVRLAAIRCIGDAGSYPAIGTGIVSAACVPIMVGSIVGIPSPNDHLTPCPYCRRKLSSCRGPHRSRSRPAICARIVFPASVCIESWVDINWNNSAPDDHLTASPHCCVIASRSWRFASWCPAIASGIVSPTGI